MKYFLLFLLSILLLTSCTGTPENEPPVFVIAGVQNGDKSQLVLLEDDYKSASDTTPRFKSFAEADLNAPAIAFDIVDRINTRSELVVLTRKDGDVTQSFLEFFSLLGIEKAADFAENKGKQLDLSTLTDLPTTIDLCPTSIQITRDGSLAAIFNNPEICQGPDNKKSLLLIDIKNKKYLNQITTIGVFPLSPLGASIDQNNDALYFLSTTGNSGVSLNRLDRNNINSSNNFSSSNSCNIIICYKENLQNNINQSGFVKRSSDVLILNRSQNLYTYSTFSGNELKNTDILTIGQGQSFIHDYTNQYNQVFVLSNNRIAIHQTPETTTTPNRIEGSTSAMLGTINTFTDFMYLARDNVLEVYDLLELQDNPTSVALEVETGLVDLNNPTILTWAQGVGVSQTNSGLSVGPSYLR